MLSTTSKDTLVEPSITTTLPPDPSNLTMDAPSTETEAPIPKLAREATDLTLTKVESSTSIPLYPRLTLSGKRLSLQHQAQFRNSLLASVGYLELANAADFAANVWNEIPVPRFAAILMGIGGTLALLMTSVAVQDFRLSLQNVRLLRLERENLREISKKTEGEEELITARLGVGIRELGTEIVDRLIMDALMGTGSILVGVGTLMAIGGANRKVYKASNLLSGYIGNGVAAVFGVINAVWSVYLVKRFYDQGKAMKKAEMDSEIRKRMKTRLRRFQGHAILNGVTGLVAGAGSLVTATRWWGYVVLIPCILSLIFCNYFWRLRLGYDRLVFGVPGAMSVDLKPLTEELVFVVAMQKALKGGEKVDIEGGQVASAQKVLDSGSLEETLDFIVQHRMLERYAESLARKSKTRSLLIASLPVDETGLMEVSPYRLIGIASNPTHLAILLDHARKFLRVEGVETFVHRERHLMELLGYATWEKQRARSEDPLEMSSLR